MIHVTKKQNVPEETLVVSRKTTVGREGVGVFVRPEKAIPEGKIRVVVAMHIELVVHGMKLWRLNEVFQPAR